MPEMTDASLIQEIAQSAPEPIASREPYTFSEFDGVTVADFESILGRK